MLSPGSKFGNYEIIEVLGSGAMGVVYKALDKRLDRFVALKFVEDTLKDSAEYQARLSKEAKLAAKIDSPFVVKVWEHSVYQENQYTAFEFVSGKDLRDTWSDYNIDLKIDVTRQIAEGLLAAHSQGLIHRDLKPENIKVSDEGKPKILDFGLAKMAQSDSVGRNGNIEGTLYYLSPEQINGKTLGFYSDVFSFGIIVYEMFVGKRPFDGEYSAAIIYSILHEDPPLPSEISKELPNWFDEFALKMLAKRPADRFENMQSLIDQLDKYIAGVIPIGLEKDIRPRKTVTVIDLKNLSEDEEWNYFSIGFTDDLISELSRRTDLTISSEPETTYTRSLREVFIRCHSDFVISGSILKWQDKIKVSLSIYGNGGENIVLGKVYLADSENIFNILSQAVNDIASKLAEITGYDQIKVDDYFKTDIGAYEYYLKGKNYYQTNKQEDLEIAIEMYKKALLIDPRLAHAHSGLSDTYSTQYMAYYDRTEKKIDMAKTEALKAIEISPNLPEAHRALGRYYMFIGDNKKAEESLIISINLNPKYAPGYRSLAWLKELSCDYDSAIQWANKSLKYAPNDLETHLLLSLINLDLKKFTVAMVTLQRAIELSPNYGRAYHTLGVVYLRLGVINLAIDNFLSAIKYKGDPNAYVYAGYSYLVNEEYDKAREMLTNALESEYFVFNTLYLLGLLEKMCGKTEASDQYFRKTIDVSEELLRKDKNNPNIMVYQALAFASIGIREKAYSLLHNLEDSIKDDGEIIYNMARGYKILGDTLKSEVLLKNAVEARDGPTEQQIKLDPHFSDLDLTI